jgi:GT2 family glycosyltransferase
VTGPRKIRTTVVILHYRGVADTVGCVTSVLAQCHDGLDVLVVDNGSVDGLGAALEGLAVPVLRLEVNAGWAGGNNAGIEWARRRKADFVCLLNNDTVVPPGVLDRMVQVATAFGPCLMHPAIDFADPTEGTQLDPSRDPDATPIAGFSTLYTLDHAYGACLLVPIALFDRIGIFDERFFLQLEETDLYERARKVGVPAVCEASVRILHAESRSFGGRITADKSYYIARNTLLLASKNPANLRLVLYLLKRFYWNVATLASADGYRGMGGRVRWLGSANEYSKAIRQAVRDFLRRRFGARQCDR